MGYGYDENCPSMHPFEWVERHEVVGNLGILAFGAYNACGLIGTEKGGIALVLEDPPQVLATCDIPWDIPHRALVVDKLLESIKRKRVDKECRILDAAAGMVIKSQIGCREFQFRFKREDLKAAFRRH